MVKQFPKTQNHQRYNPQIAVLLAVASMILFVYGCDNLTSKSDADQPLVFGMIADVQYADKDTAGNRHYRTSLQMLRECVTELNDRKPSFVIHLGDLIDGGPNAEKEINEILSVYNKLDADKYFAIGNHDFKGTSRASVLEKMGMDRGYYDFTIDSWRFVVLDTMDLGINGGWPKDSENYRRSVEMLKQLKQASAINAFEFNGGISSEQMAWLDRVLTDADKKNQRAIIFAHHPVRPADEGHNAWNSDQIVKILQSHNCTAAYFNGHNHNGGYAQENGISYITLKAMLDSPVNNAYALVELYQDRIRVVGFGNEPTRDLPLQRPSIRTDDRTKR